MAKVEVHQIGAFVVVNTAHGTEVVFSMYQDGFIESCKNHLCIQIHGLLNPQADGTQSIIMHTEANPYGVRDHVTRSTDKKDDILAEFRKANLPLPVITEQSRAAAALITVREKIVTGVQNARAKIRAARSEVKENMLELLSFGD